MNRLKISLIAAAVYLVAAAPIPAAEEHHQHQHGDRSTAGGNALIEEMLHLDAAFHEIVSGVALDDAARVRKAVESMHGSMEKTHDAVHHGTVTIPKNAGRIEDFVRQDKEFHAGLEKLAQAASKNDRDGMVTLTKKLLDQCVQCHRDFRNK